MTLAVVCAHAVRTVVPMSTDQFQYAISQWLLTNTKVEEHLGPALKVVLESNDSNSHLERLNASITRKRVEIEEICNRHFQVCVICG